MATEEGIVTKLGSNTAWVTTTRTAACEECAARNSCHALGGGNNMEVEAINTAHAQVGDRIVLSLATSSLFKATFLIYMFPILGLIAGALLGDILAPALGSNKSILAPGFGFSFFFLALIFIKLKGKRMGEKNEYRPKIIRILDKGGS